MVLLWALLSIIGIRMLYEVMVALDSGESVSFLISSAGVLAFVAAPFFGWLADAKLGNYKVVKIGITVSLFASVLLSLFTLLYYNTSLSSVHNVAVKMVLLALISLFHWVGSMINVVNSFQLSLEQIPDASAENIASLISWFAITIASGLWIGDIIRDLMFACVDLDRSDLYQILTLIPLMCTSVNFILFHYISPKWLIVEPKSPQSLKNIYRVLKFAAKHKAPLNRSALTYWEEDIPSRLDLGKSRYGGPFTTEQVEDIKVFFRILAVSLGVFLVEFALGIHGYKYYSTEVFDNIKGSKCEANGLFLFTLHPVYCAVLTVLVYELVIYPCFNHRLPSSMKKIGIISFAVLLRNVTYLVVSILLHFGIVKKEAVAPWMTSITSVLYGVLTIIIFAASQEFVCAQAPYNMRGLLSGYIQLISWLAVTLGDLLSFQLCKMQSCYLATASVGAALSIFAFVLYLIIARWYKRRVRDDIDTPHKWVEDVYDRYLSADVNH